MNECLHEIFCSRQLDFGGDRNYGWDPEFTICIIIQIREFL